jgi:hypothetical protein
MKAILTILGAAAVAIAVLALIDVFHVSDMERLEALIEEGSAAAAQGDAQAVKGYLSPLYYMDGRTYEQFIPVMERALAKYAPLTVAVISQSIVIMDDGKAQALLKTALAPGEGSRLPGLVQTSWEIVFQKEDDEWRVVGVRAFL